MLHRLAGSEGTPLDKLQHRERPHSCTDRQLHRDASVDRLAGCTGRDASAFDSRRDVQTGLRENCGVANQLGHETLSVVHELPGERSVASRDDRLDRDG